MFKKRIALFLIPMMLVAGIAFGYTRDYDVADPIDHTLNSKWPAEIREVMVDVAERLDDIMNGFTSGDTVTDFNAVPMNNRAADPSGVADTGILYTKDASGKAELFYIDEDDNVIQLTTAGSLNATQAQICGVAYPVGSIYTAGVSTNPSTLLGCGTWTAITGKVIVGIAGSGTFDTLDATGGAETVTLTAAQSGLPEHTHLVPAKNSGTHGTAANFNRSDTQVDDGDLATEGVVGGGASASSAHTNLQPYIVKYVWQRTA